MIHTLWPIYVYDAQYDILKTIKNPDIELQTGDILFTRNCTKCKYGDNIMNDSFQLIYKNMFNSFRWYVMSRSPYTHIAVIIRLNIDGEEKPYICHMDGGMPMYDEIRNKYNVGNGAVVSSLQHINIRGGVTHIYKYKGPQIKKNMLHWVKSNNTTKYPSSIYNMAMVNGLQYSIHPKGVMACTDFVENTLNYMGISNKKPSDQSTINDIVKFVHDSKHYASTPVVLTNTCYEARHFE
jgi:hypothetical protein